jgi:hypothetical protein
MKELAEKLRRVESLLSDANGPFDLFGLFLREDSVDVWDLLVAASWLDPGKLVALRKIATKVQEELGADELTKISRIVIIEETNPALAAVQQAVSVEHGLAEIQNTTFFGLMIRHAFVITARRRLPPSQALQQAGG